MKDLFNARDTLKVGDKDYAFYRLDTLEKAGLTQLKQLPFSIRIVLEAALRQCNDKEITQNDVRNIAAWTAKGNRPGGFNAGLVTSTRPAPVIRPVP